MYDVFLNADIKLECIDDSMPLLLDKSQFYELCKSPTFLKAMRGHPLNRAYEMLDEIKESLSQFYVTKRPINRKERRERTRAIKKNILRFKDFCTKNNIRIKN